MPLTPVSRSSLRDVLPQAAAILICVLLGIAMILNNQLGGEAMWFWYSTLFHQGAKLYSGMHIPLQPLYLLLTDAWMQVFGKSCIAYEVPSLLEVLALCGGIFLVLRECEWPAWQKAIILAGGFVTTVVGSSYRFDDYHVLTENLILYSFVLLLYLARTESPRRRLVLAAVLGALCGLTITTRITDGAALVVASSLSILVLSRARKFLTLCMFLLVAALMVLFIVKLTGDSFSVYFSSTVIKAAGSKGGTGNILSAPLLFLRNAFDMLLHGNRRMIIWLLALIAAGAVAQRLWKLKAGAVFALQMAIVAACFGLSMPFPRWEFLYGTLNAEFTLILTILTYVLAFVVAVRYAISDAAFGHRAWDRREILLLLPLGEWASYSAGAAAEPHTGYYAPVVLLLLLFAVTHSSRKLPAWASASFVTLLAIFAVTGITAKVHKPYSWQNYALAPMFQNRVWYRHPVYGPMYIDRDLFAFSSATCADIGAVDIGHSAKPELLSLPYPFPNYFCDTPPWHGYVQTFFDTSTRATIEHLMDELNTAPPQWIVYQRQLNILDGSERLYNNGQRLAQRDLDAMIMQKLAAGQWKLVSTSDYLDRGNETRDVTNDPHGEEWFIIRTHP